ncbi:MAG: IS66 family transposase [bacterium]|nr:IS66 family transposase [bacterium]
MGDDLPKDLDEMTDIGAMRALLTQLVEAVRRNQESIDKLTRTIEQKDEEIGQLKQMLFGKKSEKVIPVDREVKRRRKKDASKAKQDREKARQKRKKNAAAKKKLPQEEQEHLVPDEECHCPVCGGDRFSFLGWEESVEYEFVPAHFKHIVHRREQKACTCGQHIVVAPPPVRVSEGVVYGPGMHAHTVVSKCLDSIPFYRLSKRFERSGIPLARSTICDIFHRSAGLLEPLYKRIVELLPAETYVNADETRLKIQETDDDGYMWVFIGGPFVVYRFSQSRSGETPTAMLGDSQGVLQVDQYSGYNQVTTPGKRNRAGCLSHARRKFFEAKKTAPKLAEHVLATILDVYEVEYDAAADGILGTEKHQAMRQLRSKPILERLKEYLEDERPKHLPKGPAGKAIGYFVDNYDALVFCLSDPKIRLDNNISEAQLRLIALGRKNYLFVGHEVAGQNLAVLQTLVATCVANKVNPQEYLTDVLIQIQTHPQSRIDELLPHNWKPPPEIVTAEA